MAEPGGIAVSRAVRDVTELQVEYAFIDGGEHQAKNVSRSLQIYHVHARTAASTRTTTSAVPRLTLRFRGMLAGRPYGFELAIDRLMARPDGLVIGRALDQSDFVLSHSTVSRRHARLLFTDGRLQIEDLGSTNGTAVDGEAAQPGQAVGAAGRFHAEDRRHRARRGGAVMAERDANRWDNLPGDMRGVLPAGTSLRGYELISILGQGAFGITYRARDLQLHRDVAVKEYLPTSLALREGRTTVVPRSTEHAEEFPGAASASSTRPARWRGSTAHPPSSASTTSSRPTAPPTW